MALISPVFLPAPQTVWRAAARLAASGDLLNDVLISSQRVFLGFVLAAVVAIPLGVVMGVWWPAKAIMDSVHFAAAAAAVDHLDPADHPVAGHR